MVRCEVHLDAVFAEGSFGYVHHGGIIDGYVNGGNISPGEQLGGSCTNGFLAGEIELESAVVYVRVLALEDVNAFFDFRWRAARYDEMSGRLRSLIVSMLTSANFATNHTTYESLCSREPNPSTIHACYQNGLTANCIRKRLGNFQAFRLFIELGVSGCDHIRTVGVSGWGRATSSTRR